MESLLSRSRAYTHAASDGLHSSSSLFYRKILSMLIGREKITHHLGTIAAKHD